MEPKLKEHADHILRYSADLLLQIGGASEWPVSANTLDTGALNTSIKEYQRSLDGLELRVMHALRTAQDQLAQTAPRGPPDAPTLAPEHDVPMTEFSMGAIGMDDDPLEGDAGPARASAQNSMTDPLNDASMNTMGIDGLGPVSSEMGGLDELDMGSNEQGLSAEFDYFKPDLADDKFGNEYMDDEFSNLRF